ncbi:PHO8 [Candida pseudojiufengensis]|uniref:PHO8 n=1 Tax=Candida pseudojiufengensis TaxID=497109 RepID=UPI0022254336|nr:PHO8 [Candida pseudojiufengensis]KAI5963591.1 PHO8 [Candida pseudojiufengensis]
MAFIFPKILNISALALAVYFYLFTEICAAPVDNSVPKKKNIIFLVGDGLGPSGVTLARQYRQYSENLPFNDYLELDRHYIGTQGHRSNSSLITDSAAAGTALATGKKTYNKGISVDVNGKAIGAVGEALKLKGYTTGLVVTTSVADATPAVWFSHAKNRAYQDILTEQLVGETHPLGHIPSLIIGGGRGWFYGLDEGGLRPDNRSLIEEVQQNGTWNYIENREQFDALDEGKNVTLPLLGLFAEEDYPYRIDREDSEYPNLVEQTRVALNALSNATKDSDQGFFLLIESSRIDHAGHANDSPAHIQETLEYDDTIAEVLKFVKETDVDTVVVATADHETGGLVLKSTQPSHFAIISNATHSTEYLTKELIGFQEKNDTEALNEYIRGEIFTNGLGLYNITDDEVSRIAEYVEHGALTTGKESEIAVALSNLTSSRAGNLWGSTDHTSVDVGLYAFSNAPYLQQKVENIKSGLAGYHENIDFSVFIKSISDIDLDEVTEKIADIPLTR